MSPFWNKESRKPTRHGDPDEAIARYLEQIHQADVAGASPPASALNGLGDAYLDKNDVASAVDYYRQAAEIYAREGMHTNAIACLKKVRRHAVDEGDAGLLLGRYYAAKKLVPDALAELEGFAGRQEKAGNRKRAIEVLREAAQLVPNDPERRERLGDLLMEEGQTDAAAAAYREALRIFQKRGREDAADRLKTKFQDAGGQIDDAGAAAADPDESIPAAPEEPSPSPVTEVETPAPPAPTPAPEEAPPPAEAEEPLPPVEAEDPEPPAEAEEESTRRADLELESPLGFSGDDDVEGDGDAELSLGLDIERTSFREEEKELLREAREDEPEKLTVAQQTSVPPGQVERADIDDGSLDHGSEDADGGEGEMENEGDGPEERADEERADEEPEERATFDLDGSPGLADATAELERAAMDMETGGPGEAGSEAPGEAASDEAPSDPPDGPASDRAAAPSEPIVPEPRSHEEMVALAEQHVRAGETDQAGKYLLLAAEGLREDRAWQDAAHAYRRLAEIGEVRSEDFEDWVECARQTGRASEVLAALSIASRWHLKHGDVPAARRSAEEMLLVDPDNDTASEILERIGSLPSD